MSPFKYIDRPKKGGLDPPLGCMCHKGESVCRYDTPPPIQDPHWGDEGKDPPVGEMLAFSQYSLANLCESVAPFADLIRFAGDLIFFIDSS